MMSQMDFTAAFNDCGEPCFFATDFAAPTVSAAAWTGLVFEGRGMGVITVRLTKGRQCGNS
jgi:hypothetical protein